MTNVSFLVLALQSIAPELPDKRATQAVSSQFASDFVQVKP